MSKNKKSAVMLLFIIALMSFVVLVAIKIRCSNGLTGDVNAESDSLTVTVRREQYYFKNNSMRTDAYLYWADLKGGVLTLYGNTSNMYYYRFWDALGNYAENTDFKLYPDRIEVKVRTTELYYEIKGYYQPDYFQDTNFIVIFDTFWAQFSYITPEGIQQYAPVNYYNKQILPEGAGLVSYAPTDGALVVKENNSFGVVWQYKERQMDPFHKPLTYEITYNFDPIYLKFTEQMYKNQQQQQQLEQQNNLLDLLHTYFKLVSFLAIVMTILAALFAYLRTKAKFKSQLKQAMSLPKKMLKDIETEKERGRRVSSLFGVSIIGLMLLMNAFLAPHNTAPISNITPTSSNVISLQGVKTLSANNRNIQYQATIDLEKDGISYETVTMSMPYTVDNFSIWVDTKQVLEFRAYNKLGVALAYQDYGDHYLIKNVQGYIKYELVRPYVYYNNSNIIVYLDYFWLYFIDPELQGEDRMSNADITYTVIIPEGAILYSASPEDYLNISKTPEGRKEVTFTVYDREIDPYHDPFSLQITYAFVDVLEAIENQSARFEHFRVQSELTKEQQASLTRNLIFISLLGIIAPLLAFLLTYFIVRNRLMKKIKEEEQKYETLIPIEEWQIKALNRAKSIDINKEPWKAMLGEYWELLAYLSRFTPVNLLSMSNDKHDKIIRKYIPGQFVEETLEILSIGRAIENMWNGKEQVLYTKQQARDYLESVMKLIAKLEKWRKERA